MQILKSISEYNVSGAVSMLKVNMSPLFRSHCLFVPRLMEILRHKIDTVDVLEEVFGLFQGAPMMPAGD